MQASKASQFSACSASLVSDQLIFIYDWMFISSVVIGRWMGAQQWLTFCFQRYFYQINDVLIYS